jgi:hypothetical protein
LRNYQIITFLDHHDGSNKPAICEVIGEVTFENNLYLNIRYWTTLSELDDEPADDALNDEIVTIVKSTILTRLLIETWKELPEQVNSK